MAGKYTETEKKDYLKYYKEAKKKGEKILPFGQHLGKYKSATLKRAKPSTEKDKANRTADVSRRLKTAGLTEAEMKKLKGK